MPSSAPVETSAPVLDAALLQALDAASNAWNSPLPSDATFSGPARQEDAVNIDAEHTYLFPRTTLASYWLVLSDASAGAAGVDLGAVTAGPRLRLAALNLPCKVLLVLRPDADAESEARILAHWRAQIDNPPFHDRIEVFSSRTAAALPQWYAPLTSGGAGGLVNAALLRAAERGAKVVYDWALLRSGEGLELELETNWPVILPDVLPGAMPTTARLPAGADGTARRVSEDEAPLLTGASGSQPAISHHCIDSGSGGGEHVCAGLAAVTAAAPGVFFTPARRALPPVHVRVVEYDALLTLWLPRLALAGDGGAGAAVDSAWLALAVRDIWAQRLAADFGQMAVLLPRIGVVRLRSGGGGGDDLTPSPSDTAAALADAAAAAAVSWESLPADDDPSLRSAADGSATRRAAHLLAVMCARMAAAHTPSRLAPDACPRLLDELTHWLRGLASAHYEIAARPNCSSGSGGGSSSSGSPAGAMPAPPAPPPPPRALAARAWACQAATAAARSAWWARHPLVRTCAGLSTVPYYRRWRWAAASGWALAWAGADAPLPDAEAVASTPAAPQPLYPTAADRAAHAHAEAAARARGELPPAMVPDDVMVFIFTHRGRADNQAQARRSWGAYARHYVAFSNAEDARFSAAVVRASRPDWAANHEVLPDGKGAAFTSIALQHLYELGRARGIKYFLNLDDDVVPLWPSLMNKTREYQAAHGGRYPYSASGYEEGLASPRRLLYPSEASGSERHKARLAFDGGMGAPAGQVYTFSIAALHDFMGVVETCPVVHQGDAMQGAVMACAGRGLDVPAGTGLIPHTDLLGSVGEFMDDPPDMEDAAFWADPARTLDFFYQEPAPPGKQRVTVWHRTKREEEMRRVTDAYYQHWGAVRVADVPERDPHDEKPCAYHPTLVFEWQN